MQSDTACLLAMNNGHFASQNLLSNTELISYSLQSDDALNSGLMQTLHDHWTRFTVGSSSILILLGNPLSISSGDDCSLLLCTYLACRVVFIVYTQLHYHLQEKDIPQWQIQYPYYFCNNYFIMSSDWLAKWGCTEQSFTNVMHDHVLHLWMFIRTFISWFVLFFWSRTQWRYIILLSHHSCSV